MPRSSRFDATKELRRVAVNAGGRRARHGIEVTRASRSTTGRWSGSERRRGDRATGRSVVAHGEERSLCWWTRRRVSPRRSSSRCTGRRCRASRVQTLPSASAPHVTRAEVEVIDGASRITPSSSRPSNRLSRRLSRRGRSLRGPALGGVTLRCSRLLWLRLLAQRLRELGQSCQSGDRWLTVHRK